MTQRERENFLKTGIRIVDHSKDALILLTDLNLSLTTQTFEKFLNANQHDIYHFCFAKCCRCQHSSYSKRVIFPSQLESLFDKTARLSSHTPNSQDFCCSLAKPGISTRVLDVTLARFLLVNFCADVFWYSCLAFTGLSLENVLNSNKHELHHLWQVNALCCQCPSGFTFPSKQQKINTKQWNLLFSNVAIPCINHSAPTVSTSPPCRVAATHGISLSHLPPELKEVLLNCCCPLRKTISQLVDIRNEIYGHAKEAKINNLDYKTYTANIERCVLEVARVCGKEDEYRLKLQDVEKRTLDETLCTQYQNKLLEQINASEEIREEISKITPQMDKMERCLQQQNEEIKKIQEYIPLMIAENIKKNTSTKRSRLIYLTRSEIYAHKNEGVFTKTKALDECLGQLENHSVLVLSGAAGTGKSRNGLEILRVFQGEHKDFDVIKVCDLQEFKDIASAGNKTLILFEDVFGKTNCRFYADIDSHILDSLNSCVVCGDVKLVFTVRDTIKIALHRLFENHRLFDRHFQVDLSGTRFKMTFQEKHQLLRMYCDKGGICLVDSEDHDDPEILTTDNINEISNIDTLLGFPEACYLFTKNKALTRLGVGFFKRPAACLVEEIENMRKSAKGELNDRIRYVVLVYTMLSENNLDINKIDMVEIVKIAKSITSGHLEDIMEREIDDVAREMTGRYLIRDCEHFYRFQHQTILESVLLSYSKIDINRVLDHLSFDMIRELVRLKNYSVREEEVVLQLQYKDYSRLAERLLVILQTHYANNYDWFVQLICQSILIQQSDRRFIKKLIDESYNRLHYVSIPTDRYYLNEWKPIKFYLPAVIMETISKSDKHNEVLILLLKHIKTLLNTEGSEDIEIMCKTSLVKSFIFLFPSEMANEIWNILRKGCDIKLIVNHVFNDSVDAGLNSVVEWLLTDYLKEIHFLKCLSDFDTRGHNRVVSCISDLFKIDPLGREDFSSEDIFKWVYSNLDSKRLNIEDTLKMACERKQISVVHFMCKFIDYFSEIDFMTVLTKSCEHKWIEILQNLLENINKTYPIKRRLEDIETMDEWKCTTIIICTAYENNQFVLVERLMENENIRMSLVKTFPLFYETSGVQIIMMNACQNNWLDIVKLLFKHFSFEQLDVDESMTVACIRGQIEIVNYLLSQFGTERFNMRKALIHACRFGPVSIMKFLYCKYQYSKSDMNAVMTITCAMNDKERLELLWTDVDRCVFDQSVIDGALPYVVLCGIYENIVGQEPSTKCALNPTVNDADKLVYIWMLENIDKKYLKSNSSDLLSNNSLSNGDSCFQLLSRGIIYDKTDLLNKNVTILYRGIGPEQCIEDKDGRLRKMDITYSYFESCEIWKSMVSDIYFTQL